MFGYAVAMFLFTYFIFYLGFVPLGQVFIG
jgi:hypothetical protein